MAARKAWNSCSGRRQSLLLPTPQAIQQLLKRHSIANYPLNNCFEALMAVLQPGWRRPAVNAWTSRLLRWTPRTFSCTESPVIYSIVYPIWLSNQEWSTARVSLSGKRPLRQYQILSSSISNQKWQSVCQLCSSTRMSLFRPKHASRIHFP